jgi:hypothetical protein|nr:MAG TPA: hypothetical protein [Caudoviricetes sp.]
MIFAHVILPLSPLIAMSFACLVEWIVKRRR